MFTNFILQTHSFYFQIFFVGCLIDQYSTLVVFVFLHCVHMQKNIKSYCDFRSVLEIRIYHFNGLHFLEETLGRSGKYKQRFVTFFSLPNQGPAHRPIPYMYYTQF